MSIRQRAEQALARAAAATPADWLCGEVLDGRCRVYARPAESDDDVIAYEMRAADAEFAAEAREDGHVLAAFVLRVTAPEMRERIIDLLRERFGLFFSDEGRARAADALLALLTEGT